MKTLILILVIGCARLLQADNFNTYPIEKAKIEDYLQVSQTHQLFYATYGNPLGIPVIVLHGGPGVGCSDDLSRFFDLKQWYVVMFDQRGAMRSRPFACMEDNTTQFSVADIEALRKHLDINQWVVFGGSWGSCLALVYGQEHPEACLGFILRGIFLGREQDIRLFKDMDSPSSEAYQTFLSHFSKEEQTNLPKACYSKMMDSNPEIHMDMAKALMRYHMLNTNLPPNPLTVEKVLQNDRYVLSFMRAFLHYAVHQCFLQPNQVLSNIERISHLPAILIRGSLDSVCSPDQVNQLHQNWKNSQLWIIEGAGHSADDPAIAASLVQATNKFVWQLNESQCNPN